MLSTALFDKPAFKNLICNGLVLAQDGQKMSKSKKNYPPPTDILDSFGADALRLYLINSPVVRALVRARARVSPNPNSPSPNPNSPSSNPNPNSPSPNPHPHPNQVRADDLRFKKEGVLQVKG